MNTHSGELKDVALTLMKYDPNSDDENQKHPVETQEHQQQQQLKQQKM